MSRIALSIIWLVVFAFSALSFAGEMIKPSGKQTLLSPTQPQGVKTPLVVIYTLSTCSHCKEAKEYLKNNNIPFVNREIDSDQENMTALISIYDSMGVPAQNRGVPFFVIDNRIKIQGFNKGKLQEALKQVTSKGR